MELWLVLAILSYFSYSISTSMDKYFMNEGYDTAGTTTLKMFFDGIILLMFGLLFFDLTFTFESLLGASVIGILYALSAIIYFTSLKLKDVDIIMPYFQSFAILLIFISSTVLFNEFVNLYNCIGVALILIGVYVVLSKNGFKVPTLDKGIFLISVVVILNTVYSLAVKKLLFDIEPITLAIMMYFSATIILSCYMFLSGKQKKLLDTKKHKIILSSFFAATGVFLLYSALSVGNASKVYSVGGLESVFIFIFASLFLKEKFHWHRLIGIFIVVAGIFLISL